MKKIIFVFYFALYILNEFHYVHGICEFNGLIYQEKDSWSHNCLNCSCSQSVAVCVHSECELNANNESLSNTHSELKTIKQARDEKSKLSKSTFEHKTINIQSGEAIKLIADDITPTNLNESIDTNKLVYILVSEKLKFGELKIKKLYNSNEIIPQGWTKINDIYIEKVTKEFTQSDLESGNVWYEPFSDLYSVKVTDESSSQYKNIKFDLCIFEVYEKDKLNILLSKEKIEFNFKNEIVNETVLGLEVLENQVTPLTFSNFEIAGIDSSKDYLVYRIIKNLEENVGQIEHANHPGVAINNFTQGDLNKGLILYSSPKEIGLYPREFYFTFIVVNDNRGDTFPETPFYLKVLPSNNQAPRFKEAQTELVMSKGQGLTLSPKVFEVEDFDSPLETLRFSIDKKSENILIELIVDGQRKIINKNYNITLDEIKDGSIRLLASSTMNDNESEVVLKVSANDNSHTSFKTIRVKIETALSKASFLRLDATSSLLLNVKEGQIEIVRPEHVKIVNDKNMPSDIYFKITEIRRGNVSSKLNKIFKSLHSQLYFLDKPLKERMIFTQADIDRLSIRYKAPIEIGSDALIEYIYFDINDKEGNLLPNQLLTVNVEPVNNQPPSVKVVQSVKIKRGEHIYLTRDHIQIEDLDSSLDNIVINVNRQPNYGHIESVQQKNSRVSSFVEADLATGFTIRYVQNNQTLKRLAQDSFTFRVSDGLNESPITKFTIEIDSTDYVMENVVVQTKALNLSEEKPEAVLSKSHFYVNENEENADIVEKLNFVILKQPIYGRFENSNKPGFKLSNFSYEQILTNRIRYVYELDDFQTKHDDYVEFKISDKRNKKIIKLKVEIQAKENELPILQSSSYSIQLKDLERKPITPQEISITDTDSSDDELKVIITHPPQYGTLEKLNLLNMNSKLDESNNNKMISIDTSAKQKFNLILKFNNTNSAEENMQRRYMVVSEFTMSDLRGGLIFYKHRSPGVTQDSFGFVITDGTNDKYLVDNKIVSNHQIFTIYISPSESNQPPQLMRNFGLDYIDETIGEYLGRFITSNELLVVDKDDLDNELIFEISEAPSFGTLEHTDAAYSTINRFTQREINTNKIFYRLDNNFKSVFSDHFKFNIYDSVKNSILSNRFDIKWSVISFEQEEANLIGNEDEISVNLKREGDSNRSSSVVCKFVSDITDLNAKNNKSIGSVIYGLERVDFLENESRKSCYLKGVPPQASIKVLLEEPKYSLIGSLSRMTVNLLDSFEISSVSFSEDFFFVERSNDSSAFVTIGVTRTGDLSQALSIRISTSDDTAIAGLDYKPKSELLQFKPGISWIDFKVEIISNRQMVDEQAEAKRFKVSLTLDDYLSEDSEETKYAYVLIHHKKKFLSPESSDLIYSYVVNSWDNIMKQFAQPYLVPLTNSKITGKSPNDFSAVSLGSSLICLDPCRTEHPKLIENEEICSKLETLIKIKQISIETLYSWEISASNEFGIYSKYVELANAFKVFSNFNQSILDSIYLQANFRVRCSVKLTAKHRNESLANFLNKNSPKLYSNIVEIKEDSSSSNSDKSCFRHWKDSMIQQSETNALHKLANDQTGSLFLPRPYFQSNYLQSIKSLTFNKPLVAKADYISADFIKTSPVAIDTKYLNLIRISVDIPYVEGVIPLVSTLPLTKINFNNSNVHVCSNFLQIDQEKYAIKYGFVSNSNLDADEYESIVTNRLISSLNREKCMWKFVAYYDLSELTTYCQAKILTDSNVHYFQSRKNYLSVRIPLYISYSFVDSKVSWSTLDYKTQLDVMVVYKSLPSQSIKNTNRPINDYYDQSLTKQLSLDDLEGKSNRTDLQKSSKFVSFIVSKILINKEGKLVLEFSTVPSFYGQFVKGSSIEGPEHSSVQFDLELIWSQYTFDYPEQNWRAISKTSLEEYSGNYTIKLVPCIAQTGQAFKYPLECVQREPFRHTIPISIESKFKPISAKYSLGTNLALTKSLVLTNSSLFEQNESESVFDENEEVYGIITLPDRSDVESRLRLQSVYLCSSESSFMPTYDPDLRLEDKTPQLGCMTAHQSLSSRVVLLNRSDVNSVECTEKDLKIKRNQACFLTNFLSNEKNKLSNSQAFKLDGFKFDSSLLFVKNDANKNLKWFVHVEFTIEPNSQARTSFSLVRHGANMQMIILNNPNSKSMYKNFNSVVEINKNLKDKQVFNHHDLTHIDKNFSYRNIYLKMFIPLIVIVILVLFAVFSILYCKKQSPRSLVMCPHNNLTKGQLKGATRYLRFKRLRSCVSTRLNVSKEKNYQLKIKKVNSDTYMKQEENATEQLFVGSSPLLDQAEINMASVPQHFTERIDFLNVNEMDIDNVSNINSSIQQQSSNSAKIKDKWLTLNQRIREYQSQKCNKLTNMFPNFSVNKKDLNSNQQSSTSKIANLKTIFEKSKSDLTTVIEKFRNHSYENNNKPSLNNHMPQHIPVNVDNLNKLQTQRNNYLYFNYNNNKMQLLNNDIMTTSSLTNPILNSTLNEISADPNQTQANITLNTFGNISRSSSSDQITPVSSSTKCSITSKKMKRLSGTEV